MSKDSHLRNDIYNENAKIDKVKYLGMLLSTPGCHGIACLAINIAAGVLPKEAAGFMDDFTERLVETLIRSYEGDETATAQIKAIGKMLNPEVNNIAPADIQRVFDSLETHHTPAPLAQGWTVRRMMGELSWAVEPVPPAKSKLKCKVRLTMLRGYNRNAFERAAAAFQRIGRKQTTLQALAINVLQHEDPAFGEMSYEAVCKAMREVEKWEESFCSEGATEFKRVSMVVIAGGDENLLVCDSTEGWKNRKRRANKPR